MYSVVNVSLVLAMEKIVCTFEEGKCEFDDDLNLDERWTVTKSTVKKWDNTINIRTYLRLTLYVAMQTSS